MQKRKKHTIKVNNKIFNSLYDAAKFIGCFPASLLYALNHGKTKYNGFNIESVKAKQLKSKRSRTIGCKVTCTTTNEHFDSIRALARRLNLNEWTLGLKMSTAGKFIDKNGNEYVREVPIQSRTRKVDYPILKPYMVKDKVVSEETLNRIANKVVNNVANTTVVTTKKDIRETTFDTLHQLSENLTKNHMYKEASYIYEALAALMK